MKHSAAPQEPKAPHQPSAPHLPHLPPETACPVPRLFPRLLGCTVLDRETIVITVSEGEVLFAEDDPGFVPDYTDRTTPQDNRVIPYGSLDTVFAAEPSAWSLDRLDGLDGAPRSSHPLVIFRKTTIRGMAQLDWSDDLGDYHYQTPLGHTLYLRLAESLEQGGRYSLAMDSALFGPLPPLEFTYDCFLSLSEAIHVNLAGFSVLHESALPVIQPADVYHWLGEGGVRDYSGFEGNQVWMVNQRTGERHPSGTLSFGSDRSREGAEKTSAEAAAHAQALAAGSASGFGGYDQTGSPVWHADCTGFSPALSPAVASSDLWRLVVEGIGCSQPFPVGTGLYKAAFDTSLRGFYYMRIGEPVRSDIRPVPRQPRWIPHQSPPDTRILITSMHPYHPEWKTFAPGDKWDPAHCWKPWVLPGAPENTRAVGGHADALDWDRHLGHVSIIYDMLLPFILTGGACGDDNTGIAESHNGIPDLLDEARNEVDFWLSLRHGEGYSHGITNPDKDHTFYQAANTTIAAWANAANCAMLADCFRIAGLADLEGTYRDHALTAWNFASAQADQQLDKVQWVGDTAMRGADFRCTAAAYLFDLTGNRDFEEVLAHTAHGRDGHGDTCCKTSDQTWATAGYLCSTRQTQFPGLRESMAQALLTHGTAQAELCRTRPSRRAHNRDTGYFYTGQNVHRILLAHRFSTSSTLKHTLLDALILEAGWGLGRNPLNMVQMTTASSSLGHLRSVENIYTTGRRDACPGLHPGHTPYLNTDDWGKGMIMSRPRWMGAKCWPDFDSWPQGERYFNTRWVWAHSEFTPQQTMRGKMALYGYVHGLGL